MSKITKLAMELMVSIDHLEGEEWEIAAKTMHNTLVSVFENGYTTENVSELLTEEYARWNKQSDDEIIKEFFG